MIEDWWWWWWLKIDDGDDDWRLMMVMMIYRAVDDFHVDYFYNYCSYYLVKGLFKADYDLSFLRRW